LISLEMIKMITLLYQPFPHVLMEDNWQ